MAVLVQLLVGCSCLLGVSGWAWADPTEVQPQQLDIPALLQRHDADGDGKLNEQELRSVLQALAIAGPPQEAESADPLKFVRIRRDERGNPIALDTSIVSFRPKPGSKWDDGKERPIQVDLIGAIHVADAEYFHGLNRRFGDYDVVLYELVAPDGTRPEAGGRSRHPVGRMQEALTGMLDLAFQLQHIDYTAENLVHADLSPAQFAESMANREESFWKMLFRMMGHAAAQAGNQQGPSDAQLIAAFFSRNRPLKLKRVLAPQFEDLEGQMKAIEGPEGSTLISERNKRALEVLAEQLQKGSRKIGIFYGAGHMPNMASRLQKEFQMQPVSSAWLQAWDMSGDKK